MNKESRLKNEKMKYEKPELRVIQLSGEEILGISCLSGASSSNADLRFPDCDLPFTPCSV